MDGLTYVIDVAPMTVQRRGQWPSKRFSDHLPSLFFADFICRGGSIEGVTADTRNGHLVVPVVDCKDGSYEHWKPQIMADFSRVVDPASLHLIDERAIKELPLNKWNFSQHPLYETWMRFLNSIPIAFLELIDRQDLAEKGYPNVQQQAGKVQGLQGTLSCTMAELLVYVAKIDLLRQRTADIKDPTVLLTAYHEEYLPLYGARSPFREAIPHIEAALNETFAASSIHLVPLMYLTNSGRFNLPEYDAARYAQLTPEAQLDVYVRNVLWVATTSHALDQGDIHDADKARALLHERLKGHMQRDRERMYAMANLVGASLTERDQYQNASKLVHDTVM
ncbi:hypothetical protein HYV81_05380 [Candidatus Woesearchaeota archaeon]|nr:hypothetical protein [Candidatus Woesearchaeota archaeon]